MLIHMRAINNRGPYNSGEDFHVEPQDVKKHAVYAVVVQVAQTPPAAVPPKQVADAGGKKTSVSTGKNKKKTSGKKKKVTKPAVSSVTKEG
jgi:hypothetical protein